MTNRPFNILRIFIVVLVISLMVFGAQLVINKADEAADELPILGSIGPFEFVTQKGEPFGVEQLKGKISIVDFIFTRCKGPCPVMADHMSGLYLLYKDNPHIQFVSITVDPDYDSLQVLDKYASDNGVVDERWLFLRGNLEELVQLSEQSFMLSADDLPGMHSTKFVLLDENAQIRGYFNGTEKLSIEILKDKIARLLKNST